MSTSSDRDIVYQPMGKWGPAYHTTGRMVPSQDAGEITFEIEGSGELRVTYPPLWRVIVRKLILSWWWALQRKRHTP